ncbi:Cas10/Cmr2 second palm domain-containing protein [Shouchella clausii]|uniref:Cas10/Cmr2 second palm domain-containing protein n=1 Tax=Shouchella clausii TaxID=79880 RepID=UPI000BA5AE83|nr:hypothetical protein [Shouchella clausii]PAD17097.1 hypothetical protein CHH73_10340 [Shouchella clausii]
MKAYVLIDVSQKQEYIFKNTKLKDNLYNSAIIKAVTEKIPDQYSNEKIPIPITLSGQLKKMRVSNVPIYSGGGNSIIEFDSENTAEKFVRGYSLEVIKAYPDLELYISTVSEEGLNFENFQELRRELDKKLDEIKDKRKSRFRRWTYGIEKINQVGKAQEVKFNQPQSDEENEQSREQYSWARDFLACRLRRKINDQVKITNELQDYKFDESKKSYIGVISIDGNKMGEMVNKLSDYKSHQQFSRAIDSIYLKAVAKAVNDHATEELLHITPIVLAGDDICLITPAEKAIPIAKQIIENIHKSQDDNQEDYATLQKVLRQNEPLTACGGVAIVKVTYPFFDAVKKAESLCKNSKELLYRNVSPNGTEEGVQSASFIDWEITQGQVISEEGFETYVKHRNEEANFHIKPLRIDQMLHYQEGTFSYQAFEKMIDKISCQIREGKISNSTLEQIKKHMYYGWQEYQLFFDKKQTKAAQLVIAMVDELFKEHQVNTTYGTIHDPETNTYTYILNDVLETLPFFLQKEGV